MDQYDASLETTEDGMTELSQVITRHMDWVYWLCWRSVRDAALAEDITQTVFMILTQKATRLPQGANMSGWLFKTARNCCCRALRNKNMQRRHEIAAGRMRYDAAGTAFTPPEYELISLLDDQIARLGKTDRTAVLLRYYERRSFREVGNILGISEEAAKKRVLRAVEKLRVLLTGRRVSLDAGALAVLLTEKLVQPAPARLAGAILAQANNAAATAAGSAHWTIIAQVVSKVMGNAKMISAIGAIALVAGLGITSVVQVIAGRNQIKPVPTTAVPPIATVSQNNIPERSRTLHLIITGQSGHRIGGAKVYCTIASDRFYWVPLLTTFRGIADSRGEITVPIPRNRLWPFQVHVQAPHHIRILISWRPKPFDKPIKVPSHLRVMLPRGTTIGGVVMGPRGKPVEGAHIVLWLAMYYTGQRFGPLERVDTQHITVVSNADGKWSCDQAPSNLHGIEGGVLVGTWSRRYAIMSSNQWLEPVKSLAALRNGTLVLKLRNGVKINGRVVGPDGRPLKDAKIGFGNEPGGGREPPPMNVDALGHFHLAASPHQLVTLTAWAPHYAPQTQMFRMGARPKSVLFHLESGRTVHGQVLDSSGKAIQGAVLSSGRVDNLNPGGDIYTQLGWMPKLRTNRDGVFVLHHVPPGEVQFGVTDGGCASSYITIEPNSRNPQITLYPPVHVIGTVIDGKNGDPIKTFTVIKGTEFNGQPPQYDWPNPVIMQNGRINFMQYLTQTNAGMVLLIQAPGYRSVQSGIFRRSQATVDLHFAMLPASNLVEKIIDFQGHPVANVKARIVRAGLPLNVFGGHTVSSNCEHAISDAEGNLNFPAPIGRFRLLILAKQGYADIKNDRLPKSGVIRLTRWARIVGKVTVGGKPVTNWPITSQWLDSPVADLANFSIPQICFLSTARTDGSGNFVLRHVPAGNVQVSMYRMPRTGPTTAGIPGGEIKFVKIRAGTVVHISLAAPGPK